MQDNIAEKKHRLLQRLTDYYTPLDIHGMDCFKTATGAVFTVDILKEKKAVVIGYADNLQEAECNRFEDGDLFYLDEMNEDVMFTAIIQEIEL